MALFDYDRAGRSIVLTDGPEVLVHDGTTEGPVWRHTLSSRVVGVASTDRAIVALDDRGSLSFFEPATGALIAQTDTGQGARGLAALPDGICAIIGRSHATIADEEGVHRRLSASDPSCVAFSPDGMLLVGGRDGAIRVFTDGDAPFQEERLDDPVGGAAWHPGGFWVVAAGVTVWRLDPAGLERITGGPADMPIGSVACAASGHIALRLGATTALVLAYPSRETDATITYFDRKITDVCFGPGDWLGIGMDQGDGNKIDLATGATHRTDTHPGRDHHSWALSVSTGKARDGGPIPEGDEIPVPVERDPAAQRSDLMVGVLAIAVIAAVIYFLVV